MSQLQDTLDLRRRQALLVVLALLLLPVGLASAQVDPFKPLRRDMVEDQVRKRGIEQPGILSAMREIPRHIFVPERERSQAYEDKPVANLSQAYLSALMISLLELDGTEKVLEIGTGSGYDAAILSRLSRNVFTIEIDERVARQARKTLLDLDYHNVEVRVGDGYHGLPSEAPFDAILLTTAPERIPEPLFDQLAIGGKLVVALGGFVQDLQVITKTADGRERRKVSPVRLVPMTGEVTHEN